MANPTTYFGWVMPNSADLVTDLPADFNVFGQGVDTSMQYLLGGTTGQVLSKTSATNMAFTWTTPTDQTPLTTKGDLFTFTTVDARLAVGADGTTLVADSAATSGLRYQVPVNVNPVLNAAYQIWQRGTSISTASAAYTADRWYAQTATNGTVSRQVTGDTTNLPNIQYCARVQRTAAATTVTDYALSQSFESINSIPFAGKTVTLSFYARKGANYSAASSILNVALATGTGTDQNLITGYTGQALPINSTATLTTTWQRFTYTGTIATTATEMAINYYYTSVGTAGAADYFEITGVQLEVGSVATPFKTYAGTIQGELAACQRYYFQDAAAVLNAQQAVAATTVYGVYYLPVVMRSNPTLTQTGASIASSNTAATTFTADASAASPNKVAFYVTGGASTGQVYLYRPIQVSAEL